MGLDFKFDYEPVYPMLGKETLLIDAFFLFITL